MSDNISKEQLRRALNNITENDVEIEFNNLAKNPDKLRSDLEKIVDRMSEEDTHKGIEKYGSADELIKAILFYLAFKAVLIRKGIKVGLAAGAGAAIIFGTGSLCHAVANATEISAISDLADGIDMIGDIAANISDVGLAVADNGIDFFGDLVDGILSIFS